MAEHVKVQKGIKQGEKTGNFSDKSVGNLGRIVQQWVGDSTGACWEMQEQVGANTTGVILLGQMKQIRKSRQQHCAGGVWEGTARTAREGERRRAWALCRKSRQHSAAERKDCTCLGKSGHCPCLAHHSPQTESWPQQISGPSHTGFSAEIAAVFQG